MRPHPQPFHIVLIASMAMTVAACAGLRGSGQTSDPTPSASPTASSAPTASPTALPTDSPTPAPTSDHPTGATDVLLRVEWGGGFVPMEVLVTQAPQFTLYGDGTAVFRPLSDANGLAFNEPNPPFLTGHLTDAAMRELLEFALHDGGLASAETSYDFPGVADAGSTIFTINADGVDKTVSVYALSAGTDGPDQADRDALAKLQQRLLNFETEARAGSVEDLANYDPAAYKVVYFPEDTTAPPAGVSAVAWPWSDVQPSDFVANDSGPGATLTLGREHVAKLTDVPNGGQMSIWAKTPDGGYTSFAIRPLLPDEMAARPEPSPN